MSPLPLATNKKTPVKREFAYATRERRRNDGIEVTTSGFFSLPAINGLHGCARTAVFVFHTTLNWPSPRISPIITGLCRWWLPSISSVTPDGAAYFWPITATRTLSTSVLFAFSPACFHI